MVSPAAKRLEAADADRAQVHRARILTRVTDGRRAAAARTMSRMPVDIREARPEEHPAAGMVTQRAWLEFERPDDPSWRVYFERLGDVAGRAERALVLVAVERGQVVGTATVELETTLEPGAMLEPGVARFRMLAVDPERRGRGIGRALVEACLERARAAGKTAATLHTADEMAAATALYRSLGFERDPGADLEVAPGVVLRAYRLALAGTRPAGS